MSITEILEKYRDKRIYNNVRTGEIVDMSCIPDKDFPAL